MTIPAGEYRTWYNDSDGTATVGPVKTIYAKAIEVKAQERNTKEDLTFNTVLKSSDAIFSEEATAETYSYMLGKTMFVKQTPPLVHSHTDRNREPPTPSLVSGQISKDREIFEITLNDEPEMHPHYQLDMICLYLQDWSSAAPPPGVMSLPAGKYRARYCSSPGTATVGPVKTIYTQAIEIKTQQALTKEDLTLNIVLESSRTIFPEEATAKTYSYALGMLGKTIVVEPPPPLVHGHTDRDWTPPEPLPLVRARISRDRKTFDITLIHKNEESFPYQSDMIYLHLPATSQDWSSAPPRATSTTRKIIRTTWV